jgi:hypothetical protein
MISIFSKKALSTLVLLFAVVGVALMFPVTALAVDCGMPSVSISYQYDELGDGTAQVTYGFPQAATEIMSSCGTKARS